MNTTQIALDRLFGEAMAKLDLVDAPADAEDEMAHFVDAVRKHPEEHAFVVSLFESALAKPNLPLEFLQYCFHDLRWEDVKALVSERFATVQDKPRPRQLLGHMLDAFDDDWRDAEFYGRFSREG